MSVEKIVNLYVESFLQNEKFDLSSIHIWLGFHGLADKTIPNMSTVLEKWKNSAMKNVDTSTIHVGVKVRNLKTEFNTGGSLHRFKQ